MYIVHVKMYIDVQHVTVVIIYREYQLKFNLIMMQFIRILQCALYIVQVYAGTLYYSAVYINTVLNTNTAQGI